MTQDTNTNTASGAADLASRLRNACTSVRSKSYPLSDLIPLMQQAADALASTPAQPVTQADSVQEDAARYRWLRERSSTMFVNISINGEGAEIAETLDSAVDAARKQGANHDNP